jgi:hypothetical protein
VALLLLPRAAAAETRVALFAGYASEIRRAEKPGDTSYGWGLGARVEHRFDTGLYAAGAFVHHFGSNERAEDPSGASTYRADRHASYLGPELGWELATRVLTFRPYLGAGAWYVFDRTVVRNREQEDNGLSPYVLPGLFVGYRAEAWSAGLDFRMPIATALPLADAAPTLFLTFGFVVSRGRHAPPALTGTR